jgi:hypothetical protein
MYTFCHSWREDDGRAGAVGTAEAAFAWGDDLDEKEQAKARGCKRHLDVALG